MSIFKEFELLLDQPGWVRDGEYLLHSTGFAINPKALKPKGIYNIELDRWLLHQKARGLQDTLEGQQALEETGHLWMDLTDWEQ